ncbi:MAG: DUF2178 domain-containing protein [Rhizomicrobium sp.]
MTRKSYRYVSFLTAMLAVAGCSLALSGKVYWVMAAAILAGLQILMALRRQTSALLSDERDRQIAGRVAQCVVQTFVWVGLGAALLLFIFADHNPLFTVIAATLCCAVIGLGVFYALVCFYQHHFPDGRYAVLFSIAAVLALLFTIVTVLRILSGEDDWMCVQGKWVAHGHPAQAAPVTPCPGPRG